MLLLLLLSLSPSSGLSAALSLSPLSPSLPPSLPPSSVLFPAPSLLPYSSRLSTVRLTAVCGRLFQIKHADPPLSLHGQLLWREFFYVAATNNPNFDKMAGNPICVQIPWDKNPKALAKWASVSIFLTRHSLWNLSQGVSSQGVNISLFVHDICSSVYLAYQFH